MKRTLLTTLALILPLSLAQKGNDLNFISMDAAPKWNVFMQVEGTFPNPGKSISASVDCTKGVTSHDPELFKVWLERTGSTVKGNTLVTPWITLSCDQNRLTAQAKTIDEILKLLMSLPDVGELGGGEDPKQGIRMAFFEKEWCVYPDIRYKCTKDFLYLTARNGVLKQANAVYELSNRPIVGARQNGGPVVPVVFEGKSTPFQFNPEQPLEVFVKTINIGYWQYLLIEGAQGKLTWWKSNDAPQ